jgi:(1->4)-alpha-D-glucan 1-alpha-D-glucosylmutase
VPWPRATYRLQLRPDFGFAAACAVVPYLRDLGVSDLYLSPVFEARPGSAHGYDVTDPTRVRQELGGRVGFDALVAAARAAGMGIVLDVVPNHMAASGANPWWRAVLCGGREAREAALFDIDWSGGGQCPPGRVLLPILDRDVGEAIATGAVRLVENGEGEWALHAGDEKLPVAGPVERGDDIGAILARQVYVLAQWRPGVQPNYRRFFDIDDLVGVRVEDPNVFDATHTLVLELVHSGAITGLRIDHVDGLTDPRAYLERLRAAVGPDVYLIVEKILTGDEELRAGWPVDGTTGYEAMAELDTLFVDPDGLRELDRWYRDVDGGRPFVEVEHAAKHDVVTGMFAGELARVATALELTDTAALAAVTVACPVYRTYVSGGEADPEDVSGIDTATASHLDLRPALLAGSSRWEQLTAPVMAKGHEDTAEYRHTRLVSLNDVGADPDAALRGDAVARFHSGNGSRRRRGLHGLTTTSTHDTKRSEDVRARISVLSELPGEWHAALEEWRRAHGDDVVAADDQRLLAQSLVGVWPATAERVRAYMVKAAREAKRFTNWLAPNHEYEAALSTMVDAQYADGGRRFLDPFGDLLATVQFFGALNSLAQLTLKLATPGVPDVYQGSELWDLSLVDPDNRRPVDFEHRRALLDAFRDVKDPRELLASWPDGRIKLWVAHRGLELRRRHPAVFADGEYLPLEVAGARAANVVAFARRREDAWAVAIAPRLCAQLVPVGTFPVGSVWGDTRIRLPRDAPQSWTDAITGTRVDAPGCALDLARVLGTLPVALLERGGHSTRS